MSSDPEILPAGYCLDYYLIERVLGRGGYEITYLAEHVDSAERVVIREFFPHSFCHRGANQSVEVELDSDEFSPGLSAYSAETARLIDLHHPALENVIDGFEANGTAYRVLEYVDGRTLAELVRSDGNVDEASLKQILGDVTGGLDYLHGKGMFHLGVRAHEILVRRDSSAVLLAFSPARRAFFSQSGTLDRIARDDYSPVESFLSSDGEVGPWTDIYMLGMVAYYATSADSGAGMLDAVTRIKLQGDMPPAVQRAQGNYGVALLEAIDHAIMVEPEDRPQTIAQWREELFGALAAEDSASADHLHALKNGYQLHEYRIERVLGAGGFGITYLAYDTLLKKTVAIKEYLPSEFALRLEGETVLPKAFADQDDYNWGLRRFLDEASTLAQFDHPNLNRVYRVFEGNGTAYIVLDYVEGQTLSDLLKQRGCLTEPVLIRLLTELLSGLKCVHEAGYVHRDIKPGNIMIRPDGSAVLLDFGAARQAIGQRSKSLTSILTPGYAPIEQYDSKAEDVGPWSDIYALGMLAYRAVTGVGDGELPDAVTRSRYRSKGQHQRDIKPAVEAAAGQFGAALLASIDRAIQLEEEARFQKVQEWQRALSAGEDEQRDPVGSTPQVIAGNPWLWSIAVIALIAVAGGGLWLWQNSTTDAGKDVGTYDGFVDTRPGNADSTLSAGDQTTTGSSGEDVENPAAVSAQYSAEQLQLLELGEKLYVSEGCNACHGEGGYAGALAGSAIVNGDTEKYIELVVNGSPDDMSMFGFGSSLTVEQLAAVMSYVKNSFGNSGGFVYPTDVRDFRQRQENQPAQNENDSPPYQRVADEANGKRVYEASCAACHWTGAAGAPKLDDKATWQVLAKKGADTLLRNAIDGIGAHPPKGGAMHLRDEDVEDAVTYMLEESR